MKKIFISMSLILGTIFLLNFCNKFESEKITDSTAREKSKKQLMTGCNPIDSVGFLHNEFLTYHYNRESTNDSNHINSWRIIYNGTGYFKRSEYDNILTSLRLFSSNKGYNSAVVDSSISRLNTLFETTNMFQNINNTDVVLDIQSHALNLLSNSLNHGFINLTEYNIFYPIFLNFQNGNIKTCDSLLSVMNLCNYNIDSVPRIFAARSIYYHSKEFWGSYIDTTLSSFGNVKKQNIQMTVNGATLAADMAGSIVGFILGDFPGAAVGGYAFSAAAVTVLDEIYRCPVCGKNHIIGE